MAVLSPRENQPIPTESQMSELKLKSGAVKSRKLEMVRMAQNVQMFGINGSQVSSSMQGLSLDWDADAGVVVVKSDSFPSEERWLLPAGIVEMKWRLV